jgi:glycolate oxidase subunit GlcD
MFAGLEAKTDAESLQKYGRDWTKHFIPKPSAIVFPKTTEEVRDLVLWARKNKQALVPSGGRTGLSAAAFALNGEVVVSFEKMNKILEFNSFDQVVHCQSGVVTETLQQFAKDKGLCYPVDFAARGSSHIGGNVATNAGGIKVLKYGLTRNWVTSLKVVTGAGDIMELNKSLVKNATGYDLRQLFIGSEGTLGFITEVTVALTKQPSDPMLIVLGLEKLEHIMQVFNEFRAKVDLLAYEMFTDLALSYVTKAQHLPKPFDTDCKYYVLIEIEKTNSETENTVTELLEKLFNDHVVLDATISQNPKQTVELWRLREDITESTSHKQPYKNDISVRVSRVPQFLTELTEVIKKEHPTFEVVWFGHIGDGNLHVNILKPDNMESIEFVKKCKAVDAIMFSMIESMEGSISAEHGVGLVKKSFLKHTRSEAEINYMKAIKKVFDPDGIINPGKIFDL